MAFWRGIHVGGPKYCFYIQYISLFPGKQVPDFGRAPFSRSVLQASAGAASSPYPCDHPQSCPQDMWVVPCSVGQLTCRPSGYSAGYGFHPLCRQRTRRSRPGIAGAVGACSAAGAQPAVCHTPALHAHRAPAAWHAGARAAGCACRSGRRVGRCTPAAAGGAATAPPAGSLHRPAPAGRKLAPAGDLHRALLSAQHGRSGLVGPAATAAGSERHPAGPPAAKAGGRQGSGGAHRIRPAALDAPAAAGAGHPAGTGGWGHGAPPLPAVRQHGQRQDRGLSAGRGAHAGTGARRAGAGDGAGDQPDAPAGTALCRPLPRPAHRLHAQWPDSSAAAAGLAGGAYRAGAHRAGHTHGRAGVAAGPAPDRSGRRARPQLQAAGRRPLFCKGSGHLPRAPCASPHPAGLGHPFAGELAPEPASRGWRCRRPLSASGHAGPHRRCATAARTTGRHEPPAPPLRVQPPVAGGHGRAGRTRGTEHGAAEPARLRSRAALRRLRLEKRMPALQRLPRVPQDRPYPALPPLRLYRTRATRLPVLRQSGCADAGPGHRAAGRSPGA